MEVREFFAVVELGRQVGAEEVRVLRMCSLSSPSVFSYAIYMSRFDILLAFCDVDGAGVEEVDGSEPRVPVMAGYGLVRPDAA
jgi:hypothetical protein